VAEPERDKE